MTYVISSNELLFQTFSQFLMDLDCLSQKCVHFTKPGQKCLRNPEICA